MAVDIDGDRQAGACNGGRGRVEGEGSGLTGTDIGAGVGESGGVRRGTRGERRRRDSTGRVAAVGAGEDEVARGIVGDRDEEVGRPAGDHRVRSGEDRIGEGERIGSRPGQVDRVTVVDQRVVGRHPVGRIEGAGVVSGEEGILRGGQRAERGEVERAGEERGAGHIENALRGSRAEEDIEGTAAVDREIPDREGAGRGAVAWREVGPARHGHRGRGRSSATEGAGIHGERPGATVHAVEQECAAAEGRGSRVGVGTRERCRTGTADAEAARSGDPAGDGELGGVGQGGVGGECQLGGHRVASRQVIEKACRL